MCENAYLSIKNPKASRALKRALDPGRRMLASLARLRFAMSATFGLRSWGPPLTKSWIRTWIVRAWCACPRYYRPQRSWGKVMFLQASVILSTGGVCSVHAGIPPPRPGTPLGADTPPGMQSCLFFIFI